MNRMKRLLLGATLVVAGCGSRSPYWGTPVGSTQAYGLTGAVVVLDTADNRALVLTAQQGQQLSTQTVPIGHNAGTAATTPDLTKLLVPSQGDYPRKTAADQAPLLTVITEPSRTAPLQTQTYTMSDPLPNLAVDPGGTWAVAYSSTPTQLVQNPNELVIFELDKAPNPASPTAAVDPTKPLNPVTHTFRSVGSQPQQIVFTPPMQLPGTTAPHHLLVVETAVDVSLLDLEDEFQVSSTPAPSEITVELSTSMTSASPVTPAGLAVYPGTGAGDDARIAIRTANDTNVYSLLLGPPAAGSAAEFTPVINLTDVGGVATDVEFVHTDAQTNGGLRVAALVPSKATAVLLDPDTSLTTTVALPAAYSNMSLVTSTVGAANPAVDVALLWGAPSSASSGIALWTLDVTAGTPYFSVQGLDVSAPIRTVDAVPANAAIADPLRVLEEQQGLGFFVLDLAMRTAAPLTTSQQTTLSIAPDGGRLWAFAQAGTQLASIDLQTLNPVPLTTDLPILSVFDVARADDASGKSRSLIALHGEGTLAATVFDALKPDPTTARRTSALLLEGP